MDSLPGRRAGVRYVSDTEATPELVAGLQPDRVVLATGSTMIWPPTLPASLREEGLIPSLRSALPDLLRSHGRTSGTAILLDMDHTEAVYASVELLASRFDRVVLVTPRESAAQDVPLVARQGIQRRLHHLGIDIRTLCELRIASDFEDTGLFEIVSVFGGDPDPIDDVAFAAYATPRSPDDALAAPLEAMGLSVQRIGDCIVPGTLMAATAAGSRIGYAL